ncbi:MAG: hypothetical protein EHM93_01975 [Bacteroidales bacterium]|nr:MAG: hypothetical protein EHM93_01975 [Bacteroidales bacterium]
MKNLLFIINIVFFAFSCSSKGQDTNQVRSDNSKEYNYSVNLKKTDDNKISVELYCPVITRESINFFFPAIIPGHYERVDFGRFISNLKAHDVDGNELKVRRYSDNCFIIQNARSLYKITYQVSSTYNTRKGKEIPPSSGSIFIKDKVFAFNTSALFGYFEGLKDTRFTLEFQKPDSFYGVTSLAELGNKNDCQSFSAENYHKLIDCPVLFAKPDTASFTIGNTLIQIGVYNETGKLTAGIIKAGVKPYLEAVQKYVGGNLPVNKYSLIVYLKDLTEFKEGIYGSGSLSLLQKIAMSKTKVGALEHGTSSFYFYGDAGKPESYLYYMQRTCTHELLHIYSPLNLKSELIANIDYQNPKMSKHLWLYEGVTDYLSWQAKLKSGLIGLDEFLNDVMRIKMLIMNKFPKDISFADWSTKILEDPWSEQYSQVYNKGTITAMMLDFEIMRLTKGQKNLAEVIFTLCEQYKNKAFKEDEIYDEFSNIVDPELKNFFSKYIIGKDDFDYKLAFEGIGFDFQEKVTEDLPISILDGGYGVEMAIERVRVYNIEKVKQVSLFQKGDKILYDVFGENCTKPFRDIDGNYVKSGTIVNVPIIRNGRDMNLQLKVEYAQATYRYKIQVNKKMDDIQKVNFNKWIKN